MRTELDEAHKELSKVKVGAPTPWRTLVVVHLGGGLGKGHGSERAVEGLPSEEEECLSGAPGAATSCASPPPLAVRCLLRAGGAGGGALHPGQQAGPAAAGKMPEPGRRERANGVRAGRGQGARSCTLTLGTGALGAWAVCPGGAWAGAQARRLCARRCVRAAPRPQVQQLEAQVQLQRVQADELLGQVADLLEHCTLLNEETEALQRECFALRRKVKPRAGARMRRTSRPAASECTLQCGARGRGRCLMARGMACACAHRHVPQVKDYELEGPPDFQGRVMHHDALGGRGYRGARGGGRGPFRGGGRGGGGPGGPLGAAPGVVPGGGMAMGVGVGVGGPAPGALPGPHGGPLMGMSMGPPPGAMGVGGATHLMRGPGAPGGGGPMGVGGPGVPGTMGPPGNMMMMGGPPANMMMMAPGMQGPPR